jgi:hypothetical protein
MNSSHSSFFRDLIGFLVGAAVAAAAAGLAFVAVYPPLPESNPSRHDRAGALALLVIVLFFCGGFIGRRAFSAEFLSDLCWPIVGSYVVLAFLCVLASFSLSETASMVAFATAGILSSAVVSLLLLRCFPNNQES